MGKPQGMAQEEGFILITGCSGRIGFRTAERLLSDYQVLGIDVYLVGHLPGIDLIGIDMASEKNLEEGLNLIRERFGRKIISVIHLAAYYSFTKGHWGQYERITINGTKNLLTKLREKFDVEQFIFSSTMLVHTPTKPGEKITEDSPQVASWNYPKSKILTEQLIHDLHGSIPYVILRIAGVYDDQCHSIPLSNQIQRIYENQLEGHVFAGDITHGAAFVHMEDVVDAICLAVKKRKELPPELTLLIGESTTLSYDELQKTISRLIYGKEWKTWSFPKPLAKLGAYFLSIFKKGFIEPWMINLADDHYELDISKAKKVLGWEPKRSVKEALPNWIETLKREPIAWYDTNKLRIPSNIAKKYPD